MAKVCEEDFPMVPTRSFKGQKSPGFYMEGYLKENLDVVAEKISDDQMFVIIISGSGHVRVGKSVLAHQVGYYLTHKVAELNKLKEHKYTINNVTFKANELQDKAFAFPRYSCICLDEGDDLMEHYWKQMSKDLRRFFRKAGQLNQFIILVMPDFFELPRSFAITRSMFLLNVKFMGKFERGYFDFYNFEKKKELYLKGKKTADYRCVPPNFAGRFTNVYTIDEQEYRAMKRKDLEEKDAEEKEDVKKKTYIQMMNEKEKEQIKRAKEKNIPTNLICYVFGKSQPTISRALNPLVAT